MMTKKNEWCEDVKETVAQLQEPPNGTFYDDNGGAYIARWTAIEQKRWTWFAINFKAIETGCSGQALYDTPPFPPRQQLGYQHHDDRK